ncbi:MAG: hypothetical protein P4L33_03335 [Capsulimonadaceae bacterium]|nr:hypothetical protein [Capsulimonadaceae bacterium]
MISFRSLGVRALRTAGVIGFAGSMALQAYPQHGEYLQAERALAALFALLAWLGASPLAAVRRR